MEVEEEAVMVVDQTLEQNDQAQPVADDGEAELYFLIAHALSGGPFAHIGETLVGEASALGLLPPRIDYTGQRHSMPYAHLRDRYSHLPQGALRQGLHDLLQYRRAELQALSGRSNVSSILDPAVLPGPSALSSNSNFTTKPPLWTSPPFSTKCNGKGLPRPHLALLRETGIAAGSSGGGGGHELLAPQSYSQLLQHHFTVRGHSSVAYCIMFDKTGSYIITGSDDRLVKVWAVTTGLLKCTCRGHDAEISDLSVSCDNSMFASSSVDSAIRVWKLRGEEAQRRNQQLGTPVSVLQGHSEAVTAIDFSPIQSHILVSSSFDGTVRVWDARDGAIAPLILYSQGAGMGPGSGGGLTLPHTLLGGGGADNARTTRHSERRQMATALNISRGAAGGVAGANGAGPGQQQAQQQQQQQHEGEGRPRRRGANQPEVGEEHEGNDDEEEEEDVGVAAAAAASHAFPTHSMLTCSFTKEGRYIVSGSEDCCVYIWRWPQKPASEANEEGTKTAADAAAIVKVDGVASTSKAAASAAPAAVAVGAEEPEAWPRIDPPAKLEGHRNDAWLTQHSNNGEFLASGSKDGTVRIWRRPRRGRRGRGASSWHLEATCACPIEEDAAALARRRGRQHPPPRVDQIAWTCDDSYLVASMQDTRVHIFSMPDGKLIHSLKGHTEAIHVLLAHPSYPSIAISAAYSGEAVVWDVVQGTALRTLDSRATRPGGRSWPDGLPFVDGLIASDGTGFGLTDAAGQLHLYGLGPRCELTYRAPYDQFLSTDYEPLLRDVHGNVVSAATQTPAHIRTGRELLTDATGSPYPLPFQDAYRNGKLLQVSEAEASYVEAGKQPGYLLAAPTLSAAVWRAYLSGGSDTSAQNAIARAGARLAEHDAALDRLESARMQNAAAAAAGGHRGGTGRGRGGAGTGGGAARTAAGNVVYLDDDSEEPDILSSEDEYDEDFDEEEATPGGGNRRAQSTRLRREQQPARHSTRILSQRGGSQQTQTQVGASRSRRMNAQELRDRQREEREERHRRRHEAHMASVEQQRRRRERHARAAGASGRSTRAAARNTRAGNREDEFLVGDSSEDDGGGGQDDLGDEEEEVDVYEIEEEDEDYSHDEDYLMRGNGGGRGGVHSEEEEEYIDTEDEEETGGGGGGNARRRKRGRRGGGEAAAGQRDSKRLRGEGNARNNGGAASGGGAGSSRPRPSTAAAPRASSSYAWLAGAEYRPGFYVPQAGDDVIYLREGHAAVLTATSDKRVPPWQSMHRGRLMRPAEPCAITSVHYSLAQDGTEATAVQACLELTDPASPLRGQSFTVDVLPPSSGQAEFVILKSRFEQAVATPWALGDRCVSYWQTGSTAGADGAGGEWWSGTIVADTREQGPTGVAADIYGCGGLWERWQIKWQGTIDSSGNLVVQEGNTNTGNDPGYIGGDGGEGRIAGPGPSTAEGAGAEQDPESSGAAAAAAAATDVEEDISRHSPWEIFLWETIRDAPIPPGTPCLDNSTCTRLASAIEIAAAQDAWTIFQAAPEWNEAYRSLSGRQEYYNRRIPLPLGLMDIVTRLHLRYYRQKEALQHDIRTISDNAAVFNGSSSDIAMDARSLARYLLAVVDAEEVEEVNVEEYLAHEEGGGGGGGGTRGNGGDGGGQDGWDVLEAEEEEEEEEEEDEEEMVLARARNRSRSGSRRPAWYEGAAAFHQPGPDERRRARGSKRRGGSPVENVASGSGRRSARVPQRVNYREMLEDGGILDERPVRDTTAAVPPQHMYSTRRAQAADEAAAVAAVEEAEAADAARQRQRMTIRLGRLNDLQ